MKAKDQSRFSIDALRDLAGDKVLEYSEVPDWASNVEASLEAIADVASRSRAGLALELAEYAIDRIERAIDGIDDSEGLCSELLHRARDIHLAAIESVPA